MDRGACWDAVHGVAKSQARLSDFTFHFSFSCIGEGNGNSLQCSCLENPSDGGAWWAAVYGVAQSWTQLKRLSSSSSSSIFIKVCQLQIRTCPRLMLSKTAFGWHESIWTKNSSNSQILCFSVHSQDTKRNVYANSHLVKAMDTLLLPNVIKMPWIKRSNRFIYRVMQHWDMNLIL